VFDGEQLGFVLFEMGPHSGFVYERLRALLSSAERGSSSRLPGRAIGELPATETHDARVDAFVWAKPPGESDGTCNGGPQAGEFWPEQALAMASRAKW
jgi:endoglucanase